MMEEVEVGGRREEKGGGYEDAAPIVADKEDLLDLKLIEQFHE